MARIVRWTWILGVIYILLINSSAIYTNRSTASRPSSTICEFIYNSAIRTDGTAPSRTKCGSAFEFIVAPAFHANGKTWCGDRKASGVATRKTVRKDTDASTIYTDWETTSRPDWNATRELD
uniref:Uncharacterized protein n=1 Tax=Colletotrichum fructicola (strain Nara gc5) TaxID=1213859 RepID=L2GGC9_COLFN